MNPCEPRPRHRGYFLDTEDTDTDPAEGESAEGFTLRVRIVRPLRRRAALPVRTAAAAHTTPTRQCGQDRRDERGLDPRRRP